MDDAYSRLANAIIVQAVKDYQEAMEKINKLSVTEPSEADIKRHDKWQNRMVQAKGTVQEVERFFQSGWFSMLTDLDGEDLLEKIKEMGVT